ncbi:serine hydrolase domain-containing protein [Conexibacter woesei]|uniref:Beta-lactamase n=1 Tax=Conexibacter woesei (strain DSM 14684 / CCUG 47730 / CIP 108061 / JCM 11494 / NBRC 100937 / ID131577) TaxID=469383 RepID=D3FCH8_CONWI|nr:serine hydrolase domain-containing protein [Conexibacter woesei]ADB49451.1 beta-lactamase [Conexibacter woesei DSM 14684]
MRVERPATVDAAGLHGRLEELVARYDVPGASVAVLAGGQVATAAAGLLNLDTGVAATADSLFQIGSITKLYTATLVMQLVDEGRIDLDAPAVTYLPELKLADPEVTAAVTVRHLLSHTSGIAGDHFPDLGRGDDVVARYVASCAELGQTLPLGATTSYCNSGFVIAGRIVELLTGQSWDDALASRLVAPLGVSRTFTQPEDVLRFRSALGHMEQDGELRPVSQWTLPRACGPAGLICATAADVVAFARTYLDAGRTPAGVQLLSPESVAAMLEPRAALPDTYTMGSHFGLGWAAFDGVRPRVYGHNGGTVGQASFLRVVPGADVAIALLTNGGHAADLFDGLVRPLLEEVAGVATPPPLEPPSVATHVALDPHAGVYERHGQRIEVERRGAGLTARLVNTGPLADVFPDPVELELVAVRPGLFATRQPGERAWNAMVFQRLEDGTPCVHFALRATPKIAES